MTDQSLVVDARAAAPADFDSTQGDLPAAKGYGASLAAQRERAGLSISDVAATLRLHPNQVRAIEQEDLDRLPALAYVRGFIRSYARTVNLDPAPLLSDLNAKLAPARESVLDGTATDYSSVRAAGRERTFPQWAIGIAVVILIALGVIGWQATMPPPAAAPAQVAIAPAPMVPAAPPVQTPMVGSAPAAATEPGANGAAVVEPIPAPADTAEPTVASSRAATGAAPTLLLRFTGESWAEVTDRNGKILLSQLSSANAEHLLDGELPLSVVIGDANFASVEVRGATFDLQPFIRNNVARFTIK